MEHVFGPIPEGGLGPRDRLCNEPVVQGATPERTYHLRFEMSSERGGDFVCKHCGLSFLHADDSK